MQRTTLVTALVLVALAAPCGWSDPFQNPPEASGEAWDTTFPYQRNAMLDFTIDPALWGPDATNAQAWELLPGIGYQLQGSYDLTLFQSDWLEAEALIGAPPLWHPNDPTGSGRTGLMGLYDWPVPSVWFLTLHFDNTPEPNLYKRVWQELDVYLSGQGVVAMNVNGPQGTFASSPLVGTGWQTWNIYAETSPNIPWEELSLVAILPPGGTFLIDDWHVATECTPEPVSALLLLAGAPVVMAVRRRRSPDA